MELMDKIKELADHYANEAADHRDANNPEFADAYAQVVVDLKEVIRDFSN